MSAVGDASLLVAATTDTGAEGAWAEEVVRAGSLVAPDLALVEATNILRRLELAGRLGRMEAGAAARDLLLIEFEPKAAGGIGSAGHWLRQGGDRGSPAGGRIARL